MTTHTPAAKQVWVVKGLARGQVLRGASSDTARAMVERSTKCVDAGLQLDPSCGGYSPMTGRL